VVCERLEVLPSVALSLIEMSTRTISPTWAIRGWLYKDGGGPLKGGWGETFALWMLAVSSVTSPEPTGEKKGSRMNSLALFQQPVVEIAIASNSGGRRSRIKIPSRHWPRRREMSQACSPVPPPSH